MPTTHKSDSNQFRCEACGRHFNTQSEFEDHQRECVAAEQTGAHHQPIEHPREEGEDRDWVSVP